MTGVLVHEWLEPIGGSENVLEELANLFPDAPIYCLWNDAPERFSPDRVRESWLARTPLRRHKALAILFMPFLWRRLQAESRPDWVLSSSHLFAHHAYFPKWPDIRRFAYIHTPARYIWSPDLDSRGRSKYVRFISRLIQPVDRKRARELTAIATNSKAVAERVRKFWGVESTVIYPPVSLKYSGKREGLQPDEIAMIESLPTNFVLGAARFVPYKRIDMAIKYGRLNNLPVVIAGDGPDLAKWEDLARDSNHGELTVVRNPSDALLGRLFELAIVYVFAAIEDFGIMPVEAMAAGLPVVGVRRGGVSESVVSGLTGFLMEDLSDSEMIRAHQKIIGISPEDCKKRASNFSTMSFRKQVQIWINNN